MPPCANRASASAPPSRPAAPLPGQPHHREPRPRQPAAGRATLYDLPILLGILTAAEELRHLPEDAAFLGELSLTGALRPVTGVLPMALCARRLGLKSLYVPAENAAEATLAGGLTVYPVKNVLELVCHLSGEESITPAAPWTPPQADSRTGPDFADVMGQENVKRALEIAAAAGTTCCSSARPARQVDARAAAAVDPART